MRFGVEANAETKDKGIPARLDQGQVIAMETGILSFEGAFLGQIMLPNGNKVPEEVVTRKLIYSFGKSE